MNYYSNGEFTIEEVERNNGYPLKKTGPNQYQGPCGYCRAEGGDKKGDNLHFNPTKGFFCGACVDNEHGKRLAQEIADSKKIKKQIYKKVTELGYTEKDIEKYQKELFSNKEMLNLVKEKTGLSEEVIREVKIGYSKDSNVFTLPMIALDDSIVGLEFRTPENEKGKFKFICKTKGFAQDPNKLLCKINSPKNPTEIFVAAGFKDGYAVLQDLKDHGRENDVLIVTNSNGEPHTAKALKPHIDFLRSFKEATLCMDNDKAGKAATEKVEQSIPVTFNILDLGKLSEINEYINDFNDLLKYMQEHNITEDVVANNKKLSVHSLLKKYIKFTNSKLNLTKYAEVDEGDTDKLIYFEPGIYAHQGCYYSIKYDSENKKLLYARKSNFTIEITRKIVSKFFAFGYNNEYKLEIVTHLGEKTTVPQVLTQKELLDYRNLHDVLKSNEVHINTLTEVELKNVVLDELNKNKEELHIYKNPSLLEHNKKPYWAYANALIDLTEDKILLPDDKTTDIIQADKISSIALRTDRGMYAPELYIPTLSYDEFIKENKDDELIQEFAPVSKTLPELLAKCLFVSTLRTYSNRPEALLALGTALMSPFVNLIFDKTMGYPINFLYGEAASGKSNLLQTIAYIFGFDMRMLSSGNDTALNLLHNMEYYRNIPLLYSEVEGYLQRNFEPTVKAVYDRNSRRKMRDYAKNQDIKAVNATLNFASNNRTYRNPQTATRLVYTEFKKDDFIVEEAAKFNNIREQYLSCVLPEILKNYKDKKGLIKKLRANIKIIQNQNPKLDLRCVNNIAIAMVGTDLLFTAANFDKDYLQSDEIKLFQSNLENYTKAYQDMTHTEDVFEKFLRIFLLLAKSGRIQYGSEYVFNAKKKELSIYVNGVYQHFKKEFKQSEDSGVIIPEAKDIMAQAQKLPFVEYKSKNFGDNKTNRALVITIPDNHEMLSFILDELVIYQEELAEREGSKDHAIQTRYAKDKLDEANAI